MRNTVAIVAAVLLLIGVGYAVRGSRDAGEAQRLQHVADSLVLARDAAIRAAQTTHTVDSVEAARADSLALIQMRHVRASDSARQIADQRLHATDSALHVARSGADSLPFLVVANGSLRSEVSALTVELAHVDSARVSDSTAYQRQLAASVALSSIIRQDSATFQVLRDSVHAIGHLPALLPQPFTGKMLHAAETTAIAITTVQACSGHLLSLGCLSGVIVTGLRVWPR